MIFVGRNNADLSYFDKKTVGLDFEGMKADIKAAPQGSIILLHACAHVSRARR